MNTTAPLAAAPRQLLSTTARAAAAVMVVVFLSAAWLSAGRASHQAVVTTVGALNATHVTLPSVDIVAQREGPVTVSASGVAATNDL